MSYELYYWPSIPGRGEFVRLALEVAGASYRDVARERHGIETMLGIMNVDVESEGVERPPFAPPFLRDGEVMVGQTSAILLYLGPRLGLVPESEALRLWAHQIQLTIADAVAEAHDVHHPVGSGLYYDEQKTEARRAAKGFREERIGKYLAWFERILARNPAGDGHLVGDALTYADVSLFHLVDGLRYAFPRTMRRAERSARRVVALHDQVRGLPRIVEYMKSDRRIAFNEDGIFRHYPELDP